MSLLTPQPGIMKISPYVGGESKIPGIDEPIKLASNEGALGPSLRAIKAYESASGQLHRYPDGASAELRTAVAEHYGIKAERIVCGNGSDELIALIARAFAGPGDEILFTQHGFAMYPIATLAAGATPVMAEETNLTADVDKLLAKVTDKTRIVFLANPNNPTGSYIPAEEVVRLRAGLAKNILLVLDAAYAEYVTRNDYTPGTELVDATHNIVMTRTFSKIHGLAGLRLGWAHVPEDVADVLNRLRGPFNVNLPAQLAGVAALQDVSHVDAARTHNDEWLPWFSDQLREFGLEVPPSIGNFILVRFPRDDLRSAEKAADYLTSRGIIPRKVANYGLRDYLRITVGREHELRATITALKDFFV